MRIIRKDKDDAEKKKTLQQGCQILVAKLKKKTDTWFQQHLQLNRISEKVAKLQIREKLCKYSQTCVQEPPLGPQNSDRCLEVPINYKSSKWDLKMVSVTHLGHLDQFHQIK